MALRGHRRATADDHDPSGQVAYYELDTTGNVRRLRASGGADLGGYRYSAFGVAYPEDSGTPTPTVDQPLRWKGRPFLESVAGGVYDMRARWWSPRLGSYLAADSFGYFDYKGTLWSWPWQSPLRWRDSTGHLPDDPQAWEAYAAAYQQAEAQDPEGTHLIAGVGVAAAGLGLAGPAEALAYEGYSALAPIVGPFLAALVSNENGSIGTGSGMGGGPGNPEVQAQAEEAETLACSASNASLLKNQLMSTEIAGGHAFDKHLGEFPGISSRDEFASAMEDFLNSPDTIMRNLSNGRTAYWNDTTGTVLISNPKAADGGTFFSPTAGASYFWNLK